MTDAEIKELAIKNNVEFILADRSTGLTYSQMMEEDFFSFAKELEAITREKVLAELAKDNPPGAWVETDKEGNKIGVTDDPWGARPTIPLYAMPPVPDGMIAELTKERRVV